MACQGSIGRPRDSDSDSDRDRAVYNFAITFATDPATPRGASCAGPFIDTLKARAYPSRLFFCRASRGCQRRYQAHETHVPAGQTEAGSHPRFSCAHVDQGRPPRAEAASRQGPRAADPPVDAFAFREPARWCNARKPRPNHSRPQRIIRGKEPGRGGKVLARDRSSDIDHGEMREPHHRRECEPHAASRGKRCTSANPALHCSTL